ncbi:MAG TPA: hypothetical protein VJ853_04085, partial [Thermoanaerobaculia bacterium]|nr:hypothetical protein [Thermoanaerobaculia bacterium]
DGRVHRSTNGGQSWTFFDSGLNGASIYKMAVDPTGTHLALATSTGVYEYQRDLSYLSGAVTYTIALRAQSDNYVSAASCGDSYVDANSTQAGGCETFTLYDVNGGDLRDGDKVYLQAANGSFVSAENGGANGCAGCDGAVNANRIVAASWETFTIHRMDGSGAIGDGTPISLQSSAGNFLVAESGGHNACSCDSRILANRAVAAAWETFVLELR